MKKTSMLLWCSVLVIFLVACGPSESSSGSSSPSSSSFSQNSSADATSKSVEQDESVENVAVTISITDWDNTTGDSVLIESEGTYTGEMVNGVPEGHGAFTATNAEGVSWTYTGEFKNGRFHGQGTTVWDDADSYTESGTYTDGQYTPTTAELFDALGPVAIAPYSISKKSLEFIQNNQNIFPAVSEDSQAQAASLIKQDLTYPMLTKTLNGHEEELYSCSSATATQVTEEFLFGHIVTSIIAVDRNRNYYYILHDGELPDIYDDTPISFYGLAVGSSGYDNVGGGTTNVIVLLSANVTVV